MKKILMVLAILVITATTCTYADSTCKTKCSKRNPWTSECVEWTEICEQDN